MIYILLISFQLKHLLADFVLQTQYMLKKGNVSGWVLPLMSHAIVHALGTYIIALIAGSTLSVLLALSDLIIHFVVDRIKVIATRNIDFTKSKWWIIFDIDQMAHHLTHYAIIYVILRSGA